MKATWTSKNYTITSMDSASHSSHVLSAQGITMKYGKTIIIDGFSLSASPGSVTALVGENGAGKSTLLRGLAGFQPMEYESFRIDGTETPLASTRHHDLVCSVLDQSIWLRGLTVWDHFRLFARVKECQRALELFDIEHLAYRIPATLSTGQRQRANLASTVVRPWRVLLLDEPESGLDEEHQGILARYLQSEIGERAAIIATHAPDLLEEALTDVVDIETL